jgi:ribosomal protein L7/L12
MNPIKFASLISTISCSLGGISEDIIVSIAGKVQEIIEAEETAPAARVNLKPMFEYMINRNKIEAIKEYLTGTPLKESKDEIELIMDKLYPT